MRSPLLAPARRIFELALGEMLWARRTWFMALAVGAPVFLAIVTRLSLAGESSVLVINGGRVDSVDAFQTAMSVLYMRFIVPALGVFYGTSLIADEVEDRTITYLFTRPISRGAIVLGKYVAYLLCVTSVVLPSVAVMFVIMVPFGQMAPLFGTLLRDVGIVTLGVAAYGALFLWAGVAFRRPLVAGFVFVFGWEQIALALPGYLRYLTIAHYLQAGSLSVASILAVTVSAVFLAMRTIERREYVLEQ